MFDRDKLSAVPPQSELYYWADFIELQCLIDPDGHFSANRLAELVGFAHDLKSVSTDAQDADEADIVDLIFDRRLEHSLSDELADLAAEELDMYGEEFADHSSFGRDAELTDDRLAWSQSVFSLLADRAVSYHSYYPFSVGSGGLDIERRQRQPVHDHYLFLLCCSLLRYVPKKNMQALTAAFERFSLDVFRRLLPAPAQVDAYGTARGLAESRFSGTQFARLEALAGQLRARVLASEGDFHPKDVGDNGLDLVAWIPMGDDAKGLPSFFAQCACGAKWDGKQYEACHERWREFLHLSSPSTKVTFIPHHYRAMGEQWYAASDVSGILIDRLRALRAIAETRPWLPDPLVDAAWNFRLSTV